MATTAQQRAEEARKRKLMEANAKVTEKLPKWSQAARHFISEGLAGGFITEDALNKINARLVVQPKFQATTPKGESLFTNRRVTETEWKEAVKARNEMIALLNIPITTETKRYFGSKQKYEFEDIISAKEYVFGEDAGALRGIKYLRIIDRQAERLPLYLLGDMNEIKKQIKKQSNQIQTGNLE